MRRFLIYELCNQVSRNISPLILLNSAPADYKGQKSFADEFTLRTQSIKQKISLLFHYKNFSELDKTQINQLYRDLFAVYFKNPAEVEKLTLNMTKESAVSGFRVMELMSKASWIRPQINLFPELRKLNIPTLIIHGNQDIVPVYTAKEIKDAIHNSKIVYLNNCGHFPYIENRMSSFHPLGHFYLKLKANKHMNLYFIGGLFVKEQYRGRGLGSILLTKVEQIAKDHGGHLIHLDTFDFQAKDFYLKHGYEIFGVLDECPKGHKRYYMKKVL